MNAILKTQVKEATSTSEKSFAMTPIRHLPVDLVMGYWEDIARAGRLPARFCDVNFPSMDTVRGLIHRHMDQCFLILDSEGMPTCEVFLERFSGRSAQIHFSMHPDNDLRKSVAAGKFGVNTMLNVWRKDGVPVIDSLVGVISEENRASRLMAKMIGLTEMGRIKNGIWDQGKLVNAVVMKVESNG